MKRECCVCHKFLGEKPGPKDAVSHGFCEPCLEIYRAKMMAEFEELDQASPLAMPRQTRGEAYESIG